VFKRKPSDAFSFLFQSSKTEAQNEPGKERKQTEYVGVRGGLLFVEIGVKMSSIVVWRPQIDSSHPKIEVLTT
jgi:hypothetical protein